MKNMKVTIALNAKKFILKAKAKHGDKYDYSKMCYKDMQTPVTILCPIHGEFQQKPSIHIDSDCPLCSPMCVRLTTEEFIAKARKVHGDRYDYSQVNYTSRDSKITVICKEHGEFQYLPFHFLRGFNCPACRSVKIRSNAEEFIAKARKVHGDRYDYSQVNYVTSRVPVSIICPAHGPFQQKPTTHLEGKKCYLCGVNDRSLGLDQFIAKAREKHGDKYDYSKTVYINNTTKVTIICPIHGEFQQTPAVHITSICPDCNFENRRTTTEEFIAKAREVHGDRYDYSKVEYFGYLDKVTIICPIHGPFEQTPSVHVNDKCGCRKCSDSKGELKIAEILDKHGVNYVREHKLPNNKFRYDFYLPDHNVFIEFHGMQHYRYVEFFHRDLDGFKEQKVSDYCKKRLVELFNGKLITVPYVVLDNNKIESFLMDKLNKMFSTGLK